VISLVSQFRARARVLALSAGVLFCLIAASAPAAAQDDRDFGMGLIIGDPTGLTVKGFLSPETAIDGALGFAFLDGDDLSVHADFLWQFPIKQWENAALDLYLGVGPVLGFHNHDGGPNHRDDDRIRIGARAPFGLAVMFRPARFDVFVEVAAKLWLVDRVHFNLDAAIGGRYWF
jgi:hypothetical protein